MHNLKKRRISELKKLIKAVSSFKETVNINKSHNRYYDWYSSREEGLLKRLKLQIKECSKQPLLEGLYLFKIKILDRFISAAIEGRLVWFDGGGLDVGHSNIWNIRRPLTITRYTHQVDETSSEDLL